MATRSVRFPIHLVIRISAHHAERFEALAERADVTRSQLLRRLLLHYLPQWEKMIEHDRLSLLSWGKELR